MCVFMFFDAYTILLTNFFFSYYKFPQSFLKLHIILDVKKKLFINVELSKIAFQELIQKF